MPSGVTLPWAAPSLVHGLEALEDVLRDAECAPERQAAPSVEQAGQVPLEALGDDVAAVGQAAEVDDGGDVEAVEVLGAGGAGEEAAHVVHVGLGEGGGEDLDAHLAAELLVAGGVDAAGRQDGEALPQKGPGDTAAEEGVLPLDDGFGGRLVPEGAAAGGAGEGGGTEGVRRGVRAPAALAVERGAGHGFECNGTRAERQRPGASAPPFPLPLWQSGRIGFVRLAGEVRGRGS